MEKLRLEYLFKKYAGNGITPEEEAELMQYIRNTEASSNLGDLMVHAWDDAHPQLTMEVAKADHIFNTVVKSQKASGKNRHLYWIGWAATIIVICFATLYYTQKPAPVADQLIQVSTVKILSGSEHRKVLLPDGSSVILNESSSLEYPESFKGPTREVILQGEGYFDVRHDAKHKFIVHSGKVKTTVLGTAFNVSALEGNPVTVTVTRGKVSVANENRVLAVLIPDQQVVFNQQNKKANILRVKAEETVAWQKNDLFFEDATMEEAAATLSQKFNVQITFDNNQGKNCRFTATFLKAQSLEEIVKVITAFNGATYKTKPGEIIITGNNCEN